MIQQRDTYFNVQRGGLRLREETPGRPHLIQFERADQPEERQSSSRIADVDDAEALRDALAATLGIRVVVEKRRRLFLWQDVRIHLDEVDGLGCFIELEAVVAAPGRGHAKKEPGVRGAGLPRVDAEPNPDHCE